MLHHSLLTSCDFYGCSPGWTSIIFCLNYFFNLLNSLPKSDHVSLFSKSSNSSPFYWVKDSLFNDYKSLHELLAPSPPLFTLLPPPELPIRSSTRAILLFLLSFEYERRIYHLGYLHWPLSLLELSWFRYPHGLLSIRMTNIFKNAMGQSQPVFQMTLYSCSISFLWRIYIIHHTIFFLLYLLSAFHNKI